MGSPAPNTLNLTTSSSSLFSAGTSFPTGLPTTNQVDNSGMEISHPVGELQQQSTNLNPQSQGFQLQFGSSNQAQPFVFGAQNQNQNMFSANAPSQPNIFGGLPSQGLVGSAPATGGTPGMQFNAGVGQQSSLMFSANPNTIAARPMKKAKRRTSNRP